MIQVTSCPLKYHQYRPPCHRSNLCPRRTRHCHPRPRGHTCSTVSAIHPPSTSHPQKRKENIRISLVDFSTLWQLAVRFQTPRFVRTVLEYNIALLVLVVAQREQDDVALVDPDFLAQLTADVGEALLAVEAERLEAAIAEHLEHLRVLLALFLERQLALFVVVFVLAATPVFTSLYGVRISDNAQKE